MTHFCGAFYGGRYWSVWLLSLSRELRVQLPAISRHIRTCLLEEVLFLARYINPPCHHHLTITAEDHPHIAVGPWLRSRSHLHGHVVTTAHHPKWWWCSSSHPHHHRQSWWCNRRRHHPTTSIHHPHHPPEAATTTTHNIEKELWSDKSFMKNLFKLALLIYHISLIKCII